MTAIASNEANSEESMQATTPEKQSRLQGFRRGVTAPPETTAALWPFLVAYVAFELMMRLATKLLEDVPRTISNTWKIDLTLGAAIPAVTLVILIVADAFNRQRSTPAIMVALRDFYPPAGLGRILKITAISVAIGLMLSIIIVQPLGFYFIEIPRGSDLRKLPMAVKVIWQQGSWYAIYAVMQASLIESLVFMSLMHRALLAAIKMLPDEFHGGFFRLHWFFYLAASSLTFALTHQHGGAGTVIAAFFFQLVAGMYYLYSRSLYAICMAHFAYNGLIYGGIYTMVAKANGWW